MATLQIGNISVQNGVLLAPMEDVSDLSFRVICRRLGADIVYTEFVSSEGLIRDAKRSREKLRLAEEEHPVAIQIFGGDVDVMEEAAKIAEQSLPDFLDINFGCWVKNVVARNAGAALLKEPQKMAEMTKRVVNAVQLPVTVKTRLGWDKNSIEILDVAKMLEDAGAAAITIHCRTRDMGHSGVADWSWIPRIREVVNVPVILNGDVVTELDVKKAFDETNCSAVMIGRAAITNPFVFRSAKQYLATGTATPVTIEERVETCLEQLRLKIEYSSTEKRAIHEFRKFYSGYLKGLYNATFARRDLVTYESFGEIEDRLWKYANDLHQWQQEKSLENDLQDSIEFEIQGCC